MVANPDLRRVQLASIGFCTAEFATWVAILVYAYDVGGSAAVGFVAVIQLVPAALVAPFAAVAGDRGRRERVLLLWYLIQAFAMGATGFALLVDAPVPVVYASAAIAAASITLIRPTQGALLPLLTSTPEELVAANVSGSTIEGVSVLVAPALAGVLLVLWGPHVVFLGTAGLLLVSASLVARVRVRTERRPSDRRERGSTGRGHQRSAEGLVRASARGFAELSSAPAPRLLVGLASAHTITWGALDILIVVLAFETLDAGDSGVGLMNSALGAGGIIGAIVAVSLVGRRRLAPAMLLGMVLWGIPFLLLGFSPLLVVAVALLTVVGLGRTLMDVAGRTLLQRIVPDEVLTRVFGVQEGLVMAGLGLGSALAPPLLRSLGTTGSLVAFGALMPVLGLLSWRGLARADAVAVVPIRELALLRPLRVFAGLPGPVLEGLALQLEPVSIGAGETPIREGDPGDRFYVVDEGELTVSKGGLEIGVLGPGDHFGEIALLRNVPRTATVTARSDAELFSLSRDEFVLAVTRAPAAVDASEEIIEERLRHEAHDRDRDRDRGQPPP
ncbi:MAG: MFS transporter [Actinomycetota bacterium]